MWLRRFSEGRPEVRIEVRDRLELARGVTLFEIQLRGREVRDWAEEIRCLPRVVGVERIASSPGEALLRVFFRGRTYIPLHRDLGLIRQHPFPVHGGIARWTVIGPAPKVRRLVERLQREGEGMRVEFIRPVESLGARPTLTVRQDEVLQRALAAGYFDVPRRISLSDLAARLGVAVSTLSVTLALIEKKILTAPLSTAPPLLPSPRRKV
jgi:hypothetical protein